MYEIACNCTSFRQTTAKIKKNGFYDRYFDICFLVSDLLGLIGSCVTVKRSIGLVNIDTYGFVGSKITNPTEFYKIPFFILKRNHSAKIQVHTLCHFKEIAIVE